MQRPSQSQSVYRGQSLLLPGTKIDIIRDTARHTMRERARRDIRCYIGVSGSPPSAKGEGVRVREVDEQCPALLGAAATCQPADGLVSVTLAVARAANLIILVHRLAAVLRAARAAAVLAAQVTRVEALIGLAVRPRRKDARALDRLAARAGRTEGATKS